MSKYRWKGLGERHLSEYDFSCLGLQHPEVSWVNDDDEVELSDEAAEKLKAFREPLELVEEESSEETTEPEAESEAPPKTGRKVKDQPQA